MISNISGRVGDTVFGRTSRNKGSVLDAWDVKRPGRARARLGRYTQSSRVWFAIADAYYSDMPEERKQVWRDAVVAPRMSGYTLFMKEALYCLAKGWSIPYSPSESGGFSTRFVPDPRDRSPWYMCLPPITYWWWWNCYSWSPTWVLEPGTYNLYPTWGARRLFPMGGGFLDYFQEPPVPGHEFTAEVLGVAGSKVTLPWYTSTGYPTYQQAHEGVNQRYAQIVTTSEHNQVKFSEVLPPGWAWLGDLLIQMQVVRKDEKTAPLWVQLNRPGP
jgi:hypothetical protein